MDLTGKIFGRWTVLGLSHIGKSYFRYWKVRCRCGTVKTVIAHNLCNGISKSCGCLKKEKATKHGKARTPTYYTWLSMLHRCNSPKNEAYPRYGGRGIKVCKRWLRFEKFLEDMGERPEDMSIDRIKNNKGYSPENCKWSTRKEQCRNRRSNRLITYIGVTKPLVEWSELLNINYDTLKRRIYTGWTIERALETKSK